MVHTHLVLFVIVVLSAAWARPATADAKPFGGIRTNDARLRGLVDRGARISPTFRALVDRLERSDVVVYLSCESESSPSRLVFLSSAGGVRYVLVRVRRFLSDAHQLAIVAHELQHAAEVADTPAIVDAESLAREYRWIGYVNRQSPQPGISFDSLAAVKAGHLVLRELAGASME